jgi:hypothetical protein
MEMEKKEDKKTQERKKSQQGVTTFSFCSEISKKIPSSSIF